MLCNWGGVILLNIPSGWLIQGLTQVFTINGLNLRNLDFLILRKSLHSKEEGVGRVSALDLAYLGSGIMYQLGKYMPVIHTKLPFLNLSFLVLKWD